MKESPPSTRTRKKSQLRKKATKHRRDEYVSHVIRVRTWEFYYSRRASDPKSKWEAWPVSEIATLTFFGQLVRPENSKYTEGKLTFSGRHELVVREPTPSLLPIGSVTARSDEIEAYVFVPEERLRLLLTAAQSGRIQVAQFGGPKLRYGSSVIHSVSLDTNLHEDDW